MRDEEALARWRLVLGRFAEPRLGCLGKSGEQRMDALLEFLYRREYGGRGLREEDRSGGSEPTALTVPEWLSEVRELFPAETLEVLERHALDRYGLTELVTDPGVLRRLEPSVELLQTVLAFRGQMKGEVLDAARDLVRRVVERLRDRLSTRVRRALAGSIRPQGSRPLATGGPLDFRRTVRDNLKHWDPEARRLVLRRPWFRQRQRRHMDWHVVMAVDCSGSMVGSVIHSAVMAGIFAALPAIRVRLVAFDTAVVDLSDHLHDPVEILMSVQLGGGTDIAGAVGYCETLIRQPRRTAFVLVTDFFEGFGDARELEAAIRRLRGAGVRVLGLAALDPSARPAYNPEVAQRCADAGAEIAALTPEALADWLAGVLR